MEPRPDSLSPRTGVSGAVDSHFRVRKGELSICGCTLCFGIWVWANQSDAEYDVAATDSISFRIR